jgi:hypothetical protein
MSVLVEWQFPKASFFPQEEIGQLTYVAEYKMTKQIPLRSKSGEIRAYALVDDDDYDYLMQWKWHLSSSGYARRSEKIDGKMHRFMMHRVINNTPDGFISDHIDRDKLNNTRKNIRSCSYSENNVNRRKWGKSSKYHGVCFYKRNGMWKCKLQINKKIIRLGTYATEAEAAIAYNEAAIKHLGQYAKLNEVCHG